MTITTTFNVTTNTTVNGTSTITTNTTTTTQFTGINGLVRPIIGQSQDNKIYTTSGPQFGAGGILMQLDRSVTINGIVQTTLLLSTVNTPGVSIALALIGGGGGGGGGSSSTGVSAAHSTISSSLPSILVVLVSAVALIFA